MPFLIGILEKNKKINKKKLLNNLHNSNKGYIFVGYKSNKASTLKQIDIMKSINLHFDQQKNKYYAVYSNADGMIPIQASNLDKFLKEEVKKGYTVSLM